MVVAVGSQAGSGTGINYALLVPLAQIPLQTCYLLVFCAYYRILLVRHFSQRSLVVQQLRHLTLRLSANIKRNEIIIIIIIIFIYLLNMIFVHEVHTYDKEK